MFLHAGFIGVPGMSFLAAVVFMWLKSVPPRKVSRDQVCLYASVTFGVFGVLGAVSRVTMAYLAITAFGG